MRFNASLQWAANGSWTCCKPVYHKDVAEQEEPERKRKSGPAYNQFWLIHCHRHSTGSFNLRPKKDKEIGSNVSFKEKEMTESLKI